MTDSVYQGMGPRLLPLAPGDLSGASLTDPVHDDLLDMFELAINTEFAPVWTTMTTGTSMAGKNPVEQTFPFEPESEKLQQWKADYPLLCWHPTLEAETAQFTRKLWKTKRVWNLHWILRDVTIDHLERFKDTPQWLESLMTAIDARENHPAYNDGKNVFGPGAACLWGHKFLGARGGNASFATGDSSYYFAVLMRWELESVTGFTADAYPPWNSSSVAAGTGGEEGILPQAILADTRYPPG